MSSDQRSGLSGYLGLTLVSFLLVCASWIWRDALPLVINLDNQIADARFRVRGPLAPDPATPITILLVDERSLQELGQLPIARAVLADLVRRLQAAGARQIVFDMLFLEPDRQPQPHDRELAAAMVRAGNVLLPFAVGHAPTAVTPTPLPDSLLAATYLSYRQRWSGVDLDFIPDQLLAPVPVLASAAVGMGHVGALFDHDGALRLDYPVVRYDNELLPGLAVVAASRHLQVPWSQVHVELGDALHLGNVRSVPLDVHSRQHVNYYGPSGTFATHSLADMLAGRLPSSAIQGRMVLIGGTALGASDRHPSPFDAALPGVERLATRIDNLTSDRVLVRPLWAPAAELMAMLVLALWAGWCSWRLRPVWLAMLAASLAGGLYVLLNLWWFVEGGWMVSLLFPLLSLGLAQTWGLMRRARLDDRQRRAAEQALQQSEERYALAARGANDGLWDWDIDNGQVYFSPRWQELLGMDPAASGHAMHDWLALLEPVERRRLEDAVARHLKGESSQLEHEFTLQRGGDTCSLLVRGVAVRTHGHARRMAGSLTDLTERRRLERLVSYAATHDRLTGLLNRELFFDRLGQWFRNPETGGIGLVLVDVVDFKSLNETLGHAQADALLVEVARRLAQQAESGQAARLSGGQMVLAYPGPVQPALATQLQAELTRPLILEGVQEIPRLRLGYAHSSQGPATADELVNAADLALAQLPAQGAGLAWFAPAQQADQAGRHWLRSEIERALAEGGHFQLYYQPFVSLNDEQLIGFEALIRWHHPERGLISPGEFIPFAEESELIVRIGEWTLRESARQLVTWHALGFRGEIAVNLSGRQFSESDLLAEARDVQAILGDVPASQLKLEVTESMAMSNPQQTADILYRLVDMGFKISMDDFGTGYSSLAYLHRFPFHTMKIDRSFVIRLDSGREAREIVRAIVQLGRALDKQVLAEGVEELEQARVLRELGVQVAQGWLYSKALPASEAEALIRTGGQFRRLQA